MYGAPGVGTVRERAVPTELSVIHLPLSRGVVDALPGDGRVAGTRRVAAGAQRSPKGTRRAGPGGRAGARTPRGTKTSGGDEGLDPAGRGRRAGMMQKGAAGGLEEQAKGACEGQGGRGTGLWGCRWLWRERSGTCCLLQLAGHWTLMFACFFQSVICIWSVAAAGREMVIEEGSPGPSKPPGDRRPRQREKDKQQDKQQACEGFTIRAMMKNSVVGLLLA